MAQEAEIPEMPVITIGRAKTNNIVLEQKDISSNHAKLYYISPIHFLLEDIGSKNGTFVDDFKIIKVLVNPSTEVKFGSNSFLIKDLIQINEIKKNTKADPLDFTIEFEIVRNLPKELKEYKLACRNKEKQIRLWSIVTASSLGVATVLTGGTVAILASVAAHSTFQVLSTLGLGMLIPSLSTNLLSESDKMKILEETCEKQYRCPNTECGDSFQGKDPDQLAKQKICKKCKAIWVK